MSLSLLNQNTCSFLNCGLHFANSYDLIAHIEFAHIPLVVEENRKKGVSAPVEDNRVTVAPNMPLSCFQRVFPTPYRPTPVPYHPVKVSFNHYRRKPPPTPPVQHVNMTPQALGGQFVAMQRREEEQRHDGSEECSPNDPEMRWRCNWLDCPKRFKNGAALREHLRAHMRNAHHSMAADHVPPEEQASLQQHSNPITVALEAPAVATPTKYAQTRPHKCNQCSKRYKTVQGLQNHVSQAHQKLNGSNTPDANSPSPAALAQLIIQKTQGQAQQLAAERQAYPPPNQRHLPVSLAPPPQSLERPGNSPHQGHLPVRSFAVQQGRSAHQQYPVQTTGQMLKQQMNRQQLMQQQNPGPMFQHPGGPMQQQGMEQQSPLRQHSLSDGEMRGGSQPPSNGDRNGGSHR